MVLNLSVSCEEGVIYRHALQWVFSNVARGFLKAPVLPSLFSFSLLTLIFTYPYRDL